MTFNNKLVLLAISIWAIACSPNNVTVDDSLKKVFDDEKITGCFGLFDNGAGTFTIYNLSRYKDSAYSPASTFKIVNSLIGIETGVINNENMVIKWDGVVRPFPNGDSTRSWNRDLTMKEAFRISAVPYYQEIARRIGKDTMQFWLDSLKYGNHKIGTAVDMFWLDNSLKITADEQLGLVKRLYFAQLPFQKRTQQIVKQVMIQETNANYEMGYKTGLTTKENGKEIAWMVGWIEENKHPYFFVINAEGNKGEDVSGKRTKILKTILKQLGFMEGKK